VRIWVRRGRLWRRSSAVAVGGAAHYISHTATAPQSRLRRKLSDALALNPELLAKGMENAGVGTQRASRAMSVKMLVRIEAEMKALRTQGQEAAQENTERGSLVSGCAAKIEKKRSLREARSRPWADFLSGKSKNKARLKRHFSAANTIALDLEGLKAHIQATRQTVEEAEEWFRQHRLKQEQKALEAANSEAGVDGSSSSSCEKKRPPGLNLLARTPVVIYIYIYIHTYIHTYIL
jgi:hypothetical protein